MAENFSAGKCVARQQGLHGEISIVENSEYRWLCYGDDVMHSCMSRSRPQQLVLPYQHYMAAWQLFLPHLPPASALLLGTGGGDNIRFLQHYYPQTRIQAVEQDPEILRLACQWFALQPTPGQLELVVEEAGDFMLRQHAQHELIFIDMLAGENMPACLHTEEFWRACQQALSAQGLLLINGIFADSDGFMLLMKQLQAAFGVLPLCMGVPDYNNVVLLLDRGDVLANRPLVLQRSQNLAEASGQDFSAILQALQSDNPEFRF
ncbi:spermidine synthase [Sulfuriflexus mobilis]|uniref:spermidine synthase n=1 Tax=Sulfuriflexus mobilis TaxID=1811807 RepID=UPI000F81877C|nr:fused MFS/spermidine synthase [Sulfuriflexus mobilis]